MLKKIRELISLLKSCITTIQAIHFELKRINQRIDSLNDILIEDHLQRRLYNNLNIPNRLNQFEFKCYSQNGEDGLISEIFKRIGTTNEFFVEFGVQDGLETNTTLLLIKGWHGAWIEADESYFLAIKKRFESEISDGSLKLKNAFVNAENIEELFDEMKVPIELDLLSIDIDSNDYWVWNAIKRYRPRVVIIEYNSFFPPDVEWVMKYDPKRWWDSSTVFNASLKSISRLGESKGYTLIASNYTGVNAFFVRNDLILDKFDKLSLEDIYNPVRYTMTRNMGIIKGFQNNRENYPNNSK